LEDPATDYRAHGNICASNYNREDYLSDKKFVAESQQGGQQHYDDSKVNRECREQICCTALIGMQFIPLQLILHQGELGNMGQFLGVLVQRMPAFGAYSRVRTNVGFADRAIREVWD
jgi:hypothetical protein